MLYIFKLSLKNKDIFLGVSSSIILFSAINFLNDGVSFFQQPDHRRHVVTLLSGVTSEYS